MKRSFLIILLSVLILLAGCRSDPPVIRDTFEADAAVSGGALECTLHLSRTPDAVTLDILSPASVAGVRYTYTQGELHTSCGELSTIADADSLPPSGAPMLLCEALASLRDASFESGEDDVDTFRLKLSGGDVLIDCAHGIPVQIRADYSPYVIMLTPS